MNIGLIKELLPFAAMHGWHCIGSPSGLDFYRLDGEFAAGNRLTIRYDGGVYLLQSMAYIEIAECDISLLLDTVKGIIKKKAYPMPN